MITLKNGYSIMRTKILEFVNKCSDLQGHISPLSNFWMLDKHNIPVSGGAYILVANKWFIYPDGKSTVFYIGQSKHLRRRLLEHLKYSRHVRENSRENHRLYWPRYEYAGKYGHHYGFVQTHQGMTARAVEEELLASFACRYLSFPVANSSGSWNRIVKHSRK
jgi:hypothetical protein